MSFPRERRTVFFVPSGNRPSAYWRGCPVPDQSYASAADSARCLRLTTTAAHACSSSWLAMASGSACHGRAGGPVGGTHRGGTPTLPARIPPYPRLLSRRLVILTH
jgi:hypothetical protein